MRIAMFSWESLHSVAVGGVAQHVTELAAALQRRGHEVHVFTRAAQNQRFHEVVHGVHYHRCHFEKHHDFVDEINAMCRAMVHQFFWVEDYAGEFDIIHAHDWLTANALIWIKQGRPHRTFLTMHSTEYGRSGNTFPHGRSVRVRAQERAGTYWADRIIAVSHAIRREINWMYEVPESKVHVIYNGVSPHRFDIPVDVGAVKARFHVGPLDPTVLFCGRLVHHKGPDLLLQAVPHVLRHHPGAKFIFAGEGEMRRELENHAKHLHVDHACRFIGFRTGVELTEIFKSCEVVCVPSRNEPFGIVVLEAWSARKPVVATKSGGPDEFIWHDTNGIKVNIASDSIAWGINNLFSNFDRARWMGDNGRHAVDVAFTWDLIAEQTLGAYGVESKPAKLAPEPASVTTPQAVESASTANAKSEAAHADSSPHPIRSSRRLLESHDDSALPSHETSAPAEHPEPVLASVLEPSPNGREH